VIGPAERERDGGGEGHRAEADRDRLAVACDRRRPRGHDGDQGDPGHHGERGRPVGPRGALAQAVRAQHQDHHQAGAQDGLDHGDRRRRQGRRLERPADGGHRGPGEPAPSQHQRVQERRAQRETLVLAAGLGGLEDGPAGEQGGGRQRDGHGERPGHR
jgi:hypothetical protein